jgi:hypothetical protein
MKPRYFSNLILPTAIILTFAFIASTFVSGSRAYEGIPQTKDAELIQEVVNKSYDVEAVAARTFDLSSFSSIFVNDQRGGELSSSTIDFIQSVSGVYSPKYFGYLDYKIAYYSWWKSGALKLEAIQTKALEEKRGLTEDEIKSLIDDRGRMVMPRSQGVQTSTELQFVSIEIEGDKAIVIFDDRLRTNQMILVKIKDQWYIAGNKILLVHP